MQMRTNQLKKNENLFYEHVLEFNKASIKGLGYPSC